MADVSPHRVVAAAAALGFVSALAARAGAAPDLAIRAVTLPAGPEASAPRLASFGERVILSWLETGDPRGPALKFSVRESSGWSPARTVVQDARLAGDAMDVPGVAPLSGGALAAYWSMSVPGSRYAHEIQVATSRDGGGSWSTPVRPHRGAIASARGMAAIVPAPTDGGFDVVWLDARAGEESETGEGGTALYVARWDGRVFDKEAVLDPRVCDCCKTAAAGGLGTPIVAYRDRGSQERRDISVVTAASGRWSSPRSVKDDGWTIAACPTNGPAVAARGTRAAVAWFTGAGSSPTVRVAMSGDSGGSFGSPVSVDDGHPIGRVDVDLLADGSAVVVWLERDGAKALVRVRRIGPDRSVGAAMTVAVTGATRSSGYPRVAATGPREILVAWTDTGGGGSRIAAAEVTIP